MIIAKVHCSGLQYLIFISIYKLSPQGMHFLNFPPAMQTVFNLMQVLVISKPNINFATQNQQHLVRTCSIVTFHDDIAQPLKSCLLRASRRRKWGSATKSTQRSVNSTFFLCIFILLNFHFRILSKQDALVTFVRPSPLCLCFFLFFLTFTFIRVTTAVCGWRWARKFSPVSTGERPGLSWIWRLYHIWL